MSVRPRAAWASGGSSWPSSPASRGARGATRIDLVVQGDNRARGFYARLGLRELPELAPLARRRGSVGERSPTER